MPHMKYPAADTTEIVQTQMYVQQMPEAPVMSVINIIITETRINYE
jgi:hypothetical protein